MKEKGIKVISLVDPKNYHCLPGVYFVKKIPLTTKPSYLNDVESLNIKVPLKTGE